MLSASAVRAQSVASVVHVQSAVIVATVVSQETTTAASTAITVAVAKAASILTLLRTVNQRDSLTLSTTWTSKAFAALYIIRCNSLRVAPFYFSVISPQINANDTQIIIDYLRYKTTN